MTASSIFEIVKYVNDAKWPHHSLICNAARRARPLQMIQPCVRLCAPGLRHFVVQRKLPSLPVTSRQRIPHDLTQLQRAFSTSRSSRYAFAPPSPASLGSAAPPKQYKRLRKWSRRLFYISLFVGGGYLIDKTFLYSSLTRSARTFSLGLMVALDYKINFRENPPFANDINDVHTRNATKLFELLRANGGLYLKIGQAIAMQSAILPPEFQKMFARMFDDAPQNSWQDVERVIREDFGKSPEEVFGISFSGDESKGVMEQKARASASVAQVHWARLADGREVAIKVQKREIRAQAGWDLWAFKVVTWIYSNWFDLPLYSLVPFVTERLLLETDFQNEAENGERMAALIAQEPRLRDRVYIPKVYHELSSRRVMTAEWIEGVRLWDKEIITKPWLGGWRKGSPGAHGTPLDPPNTAFKDLKRSADQDHLKPDRSYWKGPRGTGGLGIDLAEVMTAMIDVFSCQMFLWGWVHCDPHPGNIFIRRLPNGHSELVLIDHGLYIQMDPKFRHEYSLFWKSLMSFDNATIKKVITEWGIKNSDLFASATLMRPYQGGDGSTSAHMTRISRVDQNKRRYEAQQAMRQGIRDILGDEEKWPRELIFLGRNFRIVQQNNQQLGSPVNRIKITGNWASRALSEDKQLSTVTRWRYYASHLTFKCVLLVSDMYFYFSRVKQFFGRGKGMDDDIEQQMKTMAKDYGVELNHSMFDG